MIRKSITLLGGITLLALLFAALAPKVTRAVAAALVQVTNTAANPVPMLNVDNPTAEPFEKELCASFVSCGSESGSFTVPATLASGAPVKRLVIENISGRCDGVGNMLTLFLTDAGNSTINGDSFSFTALTFQTVSIAAESFYSFNNGTRMYLDPGASINFSFTVASASNITLSCTADLTGFYATH